MEEYITVTAKTVKDAILEASLKLETFRDNIEYEVIEEGSTGFLGFGSKKAVIKARKKVAVEDILKEEVKEEKPARKEKKEFKKEKKEFKETKKEFKKERKEFHKEKKAEEKPVREEAVKEEPVKAAEETPVVTEEAVAPVEEAPTETRKERKIVPLTSEEKEEAKEKAVKFMKDVFASIEMEVEVTASFEDEVLNVEMSGEDMGVLIGKRGQTLDSLQYLTSLVVNKEQQDYVRVKVDTENYRSRRKDTLENLAKNIAFKVRKTRKPVVLEPMNPYERRIIHSALQGNKYVETYSEGNEPYRHVVVVYKGK